MTGNNIIMPAEADFIESRVHAMLDIMNEDLPADILTAPVAVYGHGFKSPTDALWTLYLERDFAGMRAVIDKIRKHATKPPNRPDGMQISSRCRILSRYLGDVERIILAPVAIRLYQAMNAVRTDSFLTLQLYRASLVLDSQNPADAAGLIEDVLKWTDPANNPETQLPGQLRESLETCVEMLRGFSGSGHKNPDIKGGTHHDKHAHAQSAP